MQPLLCHKEAENGLRLQALEVGNATVFFHPGLGTALQFLPGATVYIPHEGWLFYSCGSLGIMYRRVYVHTDARE